MPNTKIVRKDAYLLFSKAKGQLTGRVSVGIPEKGSFRYILIPFYLLMQEDLK